MEPTGVVQLDSSDELDLVIGELEAELQPSDAPAPASCGRFWYCF